MGQTPSDDDQTKPSLELPSLRLRGRSRRRKRAAEPVAEEPVAEEPDHVTRPAASAPVEVAPLQPVAGADAPTRRVPERADAPTRRVSGVQTRRLDVGGRAAAAIAGVVVGLFAVAATYLAMAGCDAVRGTSTCGEGPGFLILLAIVVLMILLGSLVLRTLKVDAAGSTSFLAVGIMTVVVLLVLIDLALEPVMLMVVPVLGAVAYVLAHWVTTRFDDTGRGDYV